MAGSIADEERRGGEVAAEDYLKGIYKLEAPSEPVSTSAVAEEVGRSAASVTSMLKRLSELELVEYVPYRGARLTARGRRHALRIIRRHRVIELFLIEILDYGWDDVHAEAERLEHAASDELVEQMARVLGQPQFDPHGSPIPTARGQVSEREGRSLNELEPGRRAVVVEVEDEDAEMLRFFASMDLVPGRELEVCSRARRGGPLALRVGEEIHAIDRDAARGVRVRPV